MVEGFWIVQFEGVPGGSGGGVAALTKGQIFGGDTGYTYLGSYHADQTSIKARVTVHNFLPGVPNVLGVAGDFELSIAGTVQGDVIKGSASVAQAPGKGLAVRLTKRGTLP